MRKPKRNHKRNPEPYEDMIRLEQLDPYEALIKSKIFRQKNNQQIE